MHVIENGTLPAVVDATYLFDPVPHNVPDTASPLSGMPPPTVPYLTLHAAPSPMPVALNTSPDIVITILVVATGVIEVAPPKPIITWVALDVGVGLLSAMLSTDTGAADVLKCPAAHVAKPADAAEVICAPSMLLLVSVSVVARPTNVSVAAGIDSVTVPSAPVTGRKAIVPVVALLNVSELAVPETPSTGVAVPVRLPADHCAIPAIAVVMVVAEPRIVIVLPPLLTPVPPYVGVIGPPST